MVAGYTEFTMGTLPIHASPAANSVPPLAHRPPLAALRTAATCSLREEAAQGRREDFVRYLDAVPDVPDLLDSAQPD